MFQKKVEIVPSILSADFRFLKDELIAAQNAGADRIHCDVMDGHFVPNLTFGPMVIAAVRKCVTVPLDLHLMIANPADYIEQYCDTGADTLVVHAETCNDLPGIVKRIKSKGKRAGVTVNPDKDVDLFMRHLSLIDQVLIMTVYAGFGAQRFIPEMLEKVKKVYTHARRNDLSLDIEVDGGINPETAKQCAELGANVFVSGNYVFNSNSYREGIADLRKAAEEGAKNQSQT